jgi:hypothetical protein
VKQFYNPFKTEKMKLIPLLLFACFQITFAQSYQGKWKLQNNFGDTTFLEITSDSMFFHEVLDDCYSTLSLSSNVVRYQLIDLTGRLVYDKLVENQVEYLHKNQLKSGVYMLHLIGEKGSNFERLLIE